MAEDDSHIYKVPRPTRSRSFNAHRPTPPLPIRVPVRHTDHTVYTQNQLYSMQLPTIPSSAPPALPPRNRAISNLSADSDTDYSVVTPTSAQSSMSPKREPGSSATGTSTKRWWADPSKTLPRFGSFIDKSAKSVVAVRELLSQAKRRFSEDAVVASSTAATEAIREEESSQPVAGSTLTLGKLAENHAHSFPFQVKAMQSYSFQASQLTIMNSDRYKLFFVKQQQFVSMQDSLGTSYTIPLNSAVQFGYINPSDRKHTPHTLAYKSYTKVADLMALSDREMPRVVCAQSTHKSQSRKSSLEENEVLLILQIRKSKLTGRKYLKVYSFTTKSKKSLYHDCVGHFTTNPAHLRLWLTDIANISASIFPCQAVIYLEKRFTSALKSFPSTLLKADSFVTLKEMKTQKSIVASMVTELGASQAPLLDIPVAGLLSNLRIEIQTLHDIEALQTETRKIYEGLDITLLQSLDDGITDRAYNTKCLFYTILRKGSEQEGVELIVPGSAYQNRAPEHLVASDYAKISADLDHDSDSDNEHYEKLSDWVGTEQLSLDPAFPMPAAQLPDTQSVSSASPSLSSGFHSLSTQDRDMAATPHKATRNLSTPPNPIAAKNEEDYEVMQLPLHLPEHFHYNVPTMHDDSFDLDVSDLRRAVTLLEDRIVPLEKKVAEHQQLQQLVRALSARISKLEKQLMPHSLPTTATQTHSPSVKATNIALLRSLDTSQVRVV